MNDKQERWANSVMFKGPRQRVSSGKNGRTSAFLLDLQTEDVDIFGYRIPALGILVPTIRFAGAHAYSSSWGLCSDQGK